VPASGRTRAALLLAAAALAAGCGDDEEDKGDGAAAPPAQSETTAEATETSPASPISRERLERCLTEANLELKPGSEPATDAEGKSKQRQGLDFEDTEYLGYVQWPSKSIGDVYLSEDAEAAASAATEAGNFVKAFGADPDEFVRRAGSVVLVLDDPPPSDQEAEVVEGCAGG
jgi:hypothetical protein